MHSRTRARGIFVIRRGFATLMWFESLDAVKTFMGDDYDVAHVPDAARAFLSDYDKRSAHYEVLDRRDQLRLGRR